jgi:phycocyanin beta chain
LFAEQPQLIAPGGNACNNDRAWPLGVTWKSFFATSLTPVGLHVSDASVLDDRCEPILRQETYCHWALRRICGRWRKQNEDAADTIVGDRSSITSGDCSAMWLKWRATSIDTASLGCAKSPSDVSFQPCDKLRV